MKKIIEIANSKSIYRELLLILLFSVFGIILSHVRFYIPGYDGKYSDLREIVFLISILYFRNWSSVIILNIITAVVIYTPEVFLSSLIVHSISLTTTYLIFQFINKLIKNRYSLVIIWFFLSILYYVALIIPLTVLFYKYVLTSHTPVYYNGIIYGIKFEIIATSVITTLYLLNMSTTEILKRRNKELLVAKQKAEEHEQLKTAFLQNLSHEIRTPLNGILGFSQLLQIVENTDGQTIKYTKLIIENGNQLLHIVNDIVDISQLETQQTELIIKDTDIEKLIDELLHTFAQKGELFQSRIEIDLAITNTIIKTDNYKLLRILYHLIDNALKFSNDDKSVILTVKQNDDYIIFSVRDYGIGIDNKHHNLIFNNFYQIDNELTRKYGGNGLGLAITQKFTNFLSGDLSFTSEVGSGSTFILKIPTKI